MKRFSYFTTAAADYLEIPNSSCVLRSRSSYTTDSLDKVSGGNILLSGSSLHTPRKSQRLYVGRWLTALCLSLGSISSHAQAFNPVQRDTVRGAAHVAYAINYDKVSPHFAENSQELERINGMLDLLLSDSTAALQRVVIRGYGSPDGRYALNEQLARRRTENLKAYLAKHAKLSANLIEIEYVAEDWDGLSALVEKAPQENMPHRDEVLKVIKSQQQPDEKERIIRNQYPTDFLYLKDFFLPKLRRVDYSIEYLTGNGAAAANSSGLVSINGQPVSKEKTTAGADSSSVTGIAATSSAVVGHAAAADLQAKQTETAQQGSGESSGRLKLWLAIIAGLLLLLLLLAAGVIHWLYINLQAKDENLKRLQRDISYYREELQKLETEKAAVAQGVAPLPVVTTQSVEEPVAEETVAEEPVAEEPVVEAPITEEPVTDEPTDKEEPEVVPVVASAPVVVPIPTPTPKVEQPQPVLEPSQAAPVVAQNSQISGKKDKILKSESFAGGDPDDLERFKLMDQVVTEQKLFLNADINRRNLMRLAGVDKNRFALMMRNCANTNFAGYINSKRMEYALQLIKEHPDYTMKNIAETCGFSSQSTFFRVFKSIYGVTPTEFSQTGLLPKKEAELPFGGEVLKSQKGQNSNTEKGTIDFSMPLNDGE